MQVQDTALGGGRYRSITPVGTRGQVAIFDGVDVALDRRVRIEVVRGGDRAAHRRLAEQARLLATLCHPGIVRLYDASFGASVSYIVMEHVDGRRLATLGAADGLTAGECARIGAEVAEALAHAHAHGIAHRGVRGERVAVVGPGLGPARLVGFEDAAVVAGPQDPAEDVRALGLLLARSAPAGRARGADLGPAARQAWVSLLGAMTAQEPARRPSAAQVAQALRALVPAQRPAAPAPGTAAPGRQARTLARGAVAAVFAVAAVTGAGAASMGATAPPRSGGTPVVAASETLPPAPSAQPLAARAPGRDMAEAAAPSKAPAASATPSGPAGPPPAPEPEDEPSTEPTGAAAQERAGERPPQPPATTEARGERPERAGGHDPDRAGPPAHARAGGQDAGHPGRGKGAGGGRGR